MKKAIFLLFLLFSSNAFCFELESIYEKDVTYDGIADKIIYKVWGESWNAIDWSFTIYDRDSQIYQAKSDEEYWALTVDRGDWQNCSVKAECMEDMYGPDLIERALHDVGVDEGRYGFMLETFKTYGPEWYQWKFHITEKVAEEYTKRFYEFLSGKDIIAFAIPCYHGGLLTYDKFLEEFVTYYAP
jgi:hypothetical protein